MTEIEIKGAGFNSLLETIANHRSGAFLDGMVARLPDDELRARLRTKSILPSQWLPVAWYRSALRGALEAGLTTTELEAISRDSAVRDVTGLYRVVFSMLSAELLSRQAPRLLGYFYRGGVVRPVEVKPGYARAEYEGWHGFDELMWTDYLNGTAAVFELTGAKSFTSVVVAGGRGPTMTAIATWT